MKEYSTIILNEMLYTIQFCRSKRKEKFNSYMVGEIGLVKSNDGKAT